MHTELLFTADLESALDEISSVDGRVLLQPSPQVLIAHLPDAVNVSQLKFATPDPTTPQDDKSRLLAEAWRDASAQQPEDDFREWDAPGMDAPRNGSHDEELAAEEQDGGEEAAAGDPTKCRTLRDWVAVGVIVVGGRGGPYAIDINEGKRLFSQVQWGLYNLALAGLNDRVGFKLNAHYIETTVAPGSPCRRYEVCEKPWRDSALQTMGYSEEHPKGQNRYISYLKDLFGTRWAVVIYVTTYPLAHFAYASGNRMVLHAGNDRRGREKLHYVVAHETCHLFGAPDEYASKCVCGEPSRCLKIPNNNCKKCAGRQEPCIMAGDNTYSICKWTRAQLGWRS